jgi:dynein heavy chain, axonemal
VGDEKKNERKPRGSQSVRETEAMESEASAVSLDNSAQPSHNQNQSSQPATASAVPLSQPKDDARVEFIRRLVLRTFPALQVDALHKLFAADHVAPLLFDFLHLPDARLLLFTDHGITSSGSLKVYATPPPLLFGDSPILKTPMTVLYMTKTVKGPVQVDKPHEDILTGTLERNALESLALYLQEILIPLLGNPRNQKHWPEMVTNSVLTNVHGFFSSLQIIVGQTRGATCLPLPWDHVLMENQTNQNSSGSSSRSRDNTSPATSAPLMKDQVHGLEGCLITWTKQIKTILKQDPESAALRKTHPTVHPGPLEELLFWAAKARNLNSIFAQLQSDGVRTVLQFLDSSKSTYNVPFAKLCKEVFLARAEANDNLHFLRPMATWLEQLVAEQDFLKTRDLFRPICHSILLIWKCSRFYNTPPRLVVLVRQVCNEIIRKATQYLNGRALFELIDADDLGKANAMLLHCLQVCAHFKSVYFDYKARSVTEVPGNPWRIQNNALFVRLDAFLERCHDVLELTQTIDQFQKLASMEIGGTKGKTLTASVHQIYADFQDTLSTMKSVSYDLMDLDAKHFDDDFYRFRSKNKELERRLASVINQAFDDAKTIAGRFKCRLL